MSSPGGREVGRISIRVVPNTSRFRTDLNRFLERVERTSRGARIQVDLDDSKIGNSLKRLDSNVKKALSGGVAVKAHPELREGFREELQAMVKAAAAGISINIPVDLDEEGLDNFNRKMGNTNSRIVNVNRSGGMMRRLFKGFFNVMAQGGEALGKSIGVMTGGTEVLASFGAAMGKGAGALALLGGAATLVTGAVGALAGVILAAAGAVGGLVGAAPTLLSAFGPPMAAIMVGMDGIKKAAEVLQHPFEHMKQSVSLAFEQGMRPVFEHLLDIFPLLTTELGHVATRLSTVAHEAAMFITSAQGVKIIKDIFAGFGIVLDRAKAGMGELSKQVLITAGHAPTLRVLGDVIQNMTDGLAKWLARARDSGRLVSTFAALRDIFASAGRWLGNLVDKGMEFLTAAAPGISGFFDNLRRAFSQVDFQSLGVAFGNMIASFGNFDPGTIQRFFENAAVFFQKVADFINAGHLNNFIDGLNSLAGGVNNVVEAFRSVNEFFKPVSDFFNRISGQSQTTGENVSAAGDKFQGFSQKAVDFSNQAAVGFETNAGRIPPAAHAAGAGANTNLQNALLPMPGAVAKLGRQTTNNITAGLKPMPSAAQHVANITKGNMGRGLAPMPGQAGSIGRDTANRLDSGLKSGDPGGAGRSAGQGFVNGLTSFLSSAASAGRRLGLAAWNAAKSAIEYGSPAKKFIDLGLASGEGYIIGIQRMLSGIMKAMRQVMTRTTAAGGWATLGQSIAQQIGNGLNSTLPDVVRLGTVSDEVWNQLLASGWKGDPTDRMEALYRPKDSGADLYDAVFAALNGARMSIDGAGVARLVNERNLRNRPRAGMLRAEDGTWVPRSFYPQYR